jgi:ABC-type nitrate/sulfonate/bicarbonate transport system permease component
MEESKVMYRPEETVKITDAIRQKITDPEQCSWMLAAVTELRQSSEASYRRGMAKGLVIGVLLGFVLGLLVLGRFFML